MTPPPGRREQRKAETRQAISDVATELIIRRGFEAVSMSEIAEAAGVSRKTVFNYFASKEDLVFDRDEEARDLLREGMLARRSMPPLVAFQSLVQELLESGHPLLRINTGAAAFWLTVAESPVLAGRARELQALLIADLACLMADATGADPAEAPAQLGASMLIAALVVAYAAALRAFNKGNDSTPAFAATWQRGSIGVRAALSGTAYTARDQ